MAQYLSKQALLRVYFELSKLDPKHKQGATQLVSSIRYFVALDRFFKEENRSCNVRNKADKELFDTYVGEVVAVCDGLYANQFYYPLKSHNGDFCNGSNFYSAGVVAQSLESDKAFNFPKGRSNPLFDVQNGTLTRNTAYYNNFSILIGSNYNKVALTLWLLREIALEPAMGLYNTVKTELEGLYTKELVDELLPQEDVFIKICEEKSYKEFASLKAQIEEMDIKQLFTTQNEEAFNNMKGICPIILYGAPGTGKTFKLQHEYCSNFDEDNQFMVTFHQSFCYEDFVEGLKPVESKDSTDGITYRVEKGIFYKACERACVLAGFKGIEDCLNSSMEDRRKKFEKSIKDENFVLLCIDEINRGNVSAIFGELISLIEDKKRLGTEDEMTTLLPYSKTLFGVPANLFIIGTMNTADRSIQLLDTALRRRFKFEEIAPNYKVIENETARKVLQGINAKIRCLMNKDSQIGHSYLMFAQNNKDILFAVTNKIIPLLEEYFYNDIEKVRFVLNENKVSKYSFYIEDKEAKEAYDMFISNGELEEEEKTFYILNDAVKEASTDEECAKYLHNLLGKVIEE